MGLDYMSDRIFAKCNYYTIHKWRNYNDMFCYQCEVALQGCTIKGVGGKNKEVAKLGPSDLYD